MKLNSNKVIDNSYLKYFLEDELSPKHVKKKLEKMNGMTFLNGNTYMVISKLSYPFGGGESFLMQTMKLMSKLGFDNYWISFEDVKKGKYNKDKIEKYKYCLSHKMKGGMTRKNLEKAIKLYKPDIVHTQCNITEECLFIKKEYRIPYIVGYHFWNGIIKLDSNLFNKNIIENIKSHKVDRQYIELSDQGVIQYVASKYIQDVQKSLKTSYIADIIHPCSEEKHYKCQRYRAQDRKYVTMINICEGKGGDIFLKIIEKLDKIPFLAIQTEPTSEKLDQKIKKILYSRKHCVYQHYTEDIKSIYSKTKILLLPNHVNETFCRVAYETGKNGIPILTTGKRFISDILMRAGVYISEDDISQWISKISNLYYNNKELNKISKQLLKETSILDETYERNKFKKIVLNNVIFSPNKNIMILTPWADQGLGIQSRFYTKILMKYDYRVHIFAFLPYLLYNKPKAKVQKNPEEWKTYTSIYYSFNHREAITDFELKHFVTKNDIGICIIPEICWDRLFQIADLMKKLHVKCVAIPNAEIIRKNEIKKFSKFYSILNPTKISEAILRGVNVKQMYIGHGYNPYMSIKEKPLIKKGIKFLHIAGLNSVIRKNTPKICKAFKAALTKIKSGRDIDISLTVMIEGNAPKNIYKYKSNRIKIISKHLTHRQILELYNTHHISIQVSKHEGLGLGFYESISMGTPVISLNTAPHNEVIKPNKTGWLLDCQYIDMEDNDDSYMKSAEFKIKDLGNLLIKLSKNSDNVTKLIETTKIEYMKKWNEDIFIQRFLRGIKL